MRNPVLANGPDAKPLESIEFNRHENPWFGFVLGWCATMALKAGVVIVQGFPNRMYGRT
jgi:hypothetical protein